MSNIKGRMAAVKGIVTKRSTSLPKSDENGATAEGEASTTTTGTAAKDAKVAKAAATAAPKAAAQKEQKEPKEQKPVRESFNLDALPEVSLPVGWEAKVSRSTGRVYYVNRKLGKSQFERPTIASLKAQKLARQKAGGGAN